MFLRLQSQPWFAKIIPPLGQRIIQGLIVGGGCLLRLAVMVALVLAILYVGPFLMVIVIAALEWLTRQLG